MALLDEIEWHLDKEDGLLREGRRERTIFLMRLGYPEEGLVFLNGDHVMRPWMELRTAYIHGCFQASLLIGPEVILQSDCERFLVRLHAFVHRRFGLGRLAVPEEFEALPPINPDQLEIGMP